MSFIMSIYLFFFLGLLQVDKKQLWYCRFVVTFLKSKPKENLTLDFCVHAKKVEREVTRSNQ